MAEKRMYEYDGIDMWVYTEPDNSSMPGWVQEALIQGDISIASGDDLKYTYLNHNLCASGDLIIRFKASGLVYTFSKAQIHLQLDKILSLEERFQ